MNNPNGIRKTRGQIDMRIVGAVVVGAIVIVAGLLFLRPADEPEPVPAPDVGRTTPLETVAPAESSEERGDSAREIIAKLRASGDGIDYSAAHSHAQKFQASDRQADAQLLYFFAARGGYAPAAFDLASMYDPGHFSAQNSLGAEPDPFQAYKWYREARDAGDQAAASRLDELRAWAEDAAGNGDAEAERLLLQWE